MTGKSDISAVEELQQIFRSTKFTSKENLISLLIILPTLLFHLIFTSVLHLG
ncbi:MAG: hypothetical protein GPJ54_20960 [Candidatus Heimdallarchaeota archaeon]|nr:hypothetical protein [Candidatus Heimdallarchaeota archaeon]